MCSKHNIKNITEKHENSNKKLDRELTCAPGTLYRLLTPHPYMHHVCDVTHLHSKPLTELCSLHEISLT